MLWLLLPLLLFLSNTLAPCVEATKAEDSTLVARVPAGWNVPVFTVHDWESATTKKAVLKFIKLAPGSEGQQLEAIAKEAFEKTYPAWGDHKPLLFAALYIPKEETVFVSSKPVSAAAQYIQKNRKVFDLWNAAAQHKTEVKQIHAEDGAICLYEDEWKKDDDEYKCQKSYEGSFIGVYGKPRVQDTPAPLWPCYDPTIHTSDCQRVLKKLGIQFRTHGGTIKRRTEGEIEIQQESKMSRMAKCLTIVPLSMGPSALDYSTNFFDETFIRDDALLGFWPSDIIANDVDMDVDLDSDFFLNPWMAFAQKAALTTTAAWVRDRLAELAQKGRQALSIAKAAGGTAGSQRHMLDAVLDISESPNWKNCLRGLGPQ
ncbi:hypothetical protein AJ80_06230 [Polytolypa hystricis UAMH7299]|uniref:Uncharacterized protein n=1 Tax=Polytolypa hystricis (strain UAMH7299) TaxID=1447883 RepID=A0A2B7XXQ5_POLH7|nr:hypothetical protein AJ80_06230 [Polytolypa hystricis UAMH7299]